MAQTNVPASTRHRVIADVAEYLEVNTDANEWGFLDNGETLEIYTAALESCRLNSAWRTLEQRYEAVGGSIYSPDDNEWEVA